MFYNCSSNEKKCTTYKFPPALNDPLWLICRKTKQNKNKTNFPLVHCFDTNQREITRFYEKVKVIVSKQSTWEH